MRMAHQQRHAHLRPFITVEHHVIDRPERPDFDD
jgi:hypothetical protein